MSPPLDNKMNLSQDNMSWGYRGYRFVLGLLGLRVSKDEQAGFKAEERDMVSGRHVNL